VWLSVCAIGFAQAAKTPPKAQAVTVKQRFDDAMAKDDKVRLVLTNYTDKTPAQELAVQVSQVMTSFEQLVRRFPTSGYADDALWRAASLADAAYQRLNRPEDRDKALKLYRWLVAEYPRSAFIKQANAKIAAFTRLKAPLPPSVVATLATARAAAAQTDPPPAAAPKPVTAPLLASHALMPMAMAAATIAASPAIEDADGAPLSNRAMLTSIERVVLPDAVRVTLELDREVAYKEERIAGPARLFFDLKNVETTPALKDKVLSYGSDVVNKIRIGRHPDNTVRVVLDFEEVTRYSVFTLYSPFRLVIDAERTVATTAAAEPPTPAPTPKVPATVIEEPVPAAPIAETPPPPLPPAPLPGTAAPAPPPAPTPTAAAANAAGGFSIARQLGLSVSRIVIDPGHGGHDPGTLAKGLNEAQLTLDVALRLEKLLQKDPGVEVVLTRRTDVYVPLEERTAIANRSNADLFLSIHANSSRNLTARGIETFFLSFASSPDAEAIAARENSASEREMHQLPDLIKAISLNNKLDESRDLANMVQDALVANLKKSNKDVRSRGVKKAPFVVLIGAQMPSVLAEISFLTNKQELQLLKTSAYKQRIAESLYNAVTKYRRSLKGTAVATIEP
jgi:N-acetylmuramoyl-L-alanine amidase